MLVLFGCKGTDGDDGKIGVTLTADATFKASSFAIGCFIVSNTETSCLCYESGTGYTGTATGSTTCQGYANDVTLVADTTTLSSVASGSHDYCISANSAVNCDSGTKDAVTLSANSGDDGSSTAMVLPENGEDGGDKSYTLTFSTSSVSLTE